MIIALDFGHGCQYDGGAVGIVTEELVINEVGQKIKNYLVDLGYTVVLTRPTTTTSHNDALNQRCRNANDSGADLFVSIHGNIGGGLGTEIFTYQGKETEKAVRVLNNITELGFRKRGIRHDETYLKYKLAVIHGTTMEAMLIELFFIDSKEDVELYKQVGAEKIAKAIAEGITNQEILINNTKDETIYRVQVGAFKDEKNADALIEKLKTLGFNAFKVK